MKWMRSDFAYLCKTNFALQHLSRLAPPAKIRASESSHPNGPHRPQGAEDIPLLLPRSPANLPRVGRTGMEAEAAGPGASPVSTCWEGGGGRSRVYTYLGCSRGQSLERSGGGLFEGPYLLHFRPNCRSTFCRPIPSTDCLVICRRSCGWRRRSRPPPTT